MLAGLVVRHTGVVVQERRIHSRFGSLLVPSQRSEVKIVPKQAVAVPEEFFGAHGGGRARGEQAGERKDGGYRPHRPAVYSFLLNVGNSPSFLERLCQVAENARYSIRKP